ncbi:MAG: DUF1593 domain-containing protein [Bacteroidales bacterium]|nr:DUF1593 domain-containing protein [Bacteroidales bacterium]
MRKPFLLLTLFVGLVWLGGSMEARANDSSEMPKHRVIILTDAENEPDDTESLVRLMLYTNRIDVRGLIATTSTHMRNRIAPESIHRVIDAYGQVRSNLLKHEAGFPEADALHALVKRGSTFYGMNGVGKGKNSEGSDWIVGELLRTDDDRPLWVCAWGGANVLAQALYQLRATQSAANLERLVGKLRVYTISDQDDTGTWMRREFPKLFYIVSPGGYGNATWTGMMQVAEGADNEKVSNRWLAENIQQGHGPLGACYPDVAYGMEGDTPSWLNLIPNGLNEPEHPDWGGWGGRYAFYKPRREDCDPTGFNGSIPIEEETRAIWTNAVDRYTPYKFNEYGCAVRSDTATYSTPQASVWRWRSEVQNDFAARMDWCTKDYAEANHAPVAMARLMTEVAGYGEDNNAPREITNMTVKGGDTFMLDATGSSDPDGDNLSYLWFQYPEAGSLKQIVPILGSPNIYHVKVQAPKVEKPETLHFILKVTDKGTPALTSYRRVVVTVIK